MIALFALAGQALATPLDLPKDQALQFIAACEAGDAAGCSAMESSARRAWAASKVDNAWGNDEVADYRAVQARAFQEAACKLGNALSCRDGADLAAACRYGDDAACHDAKPSGELQGALAARVAAEPDGEARQRQRLLGWDGRGGVTVELHTGQIGPLADPGPTRTFADVSETGYVTFASTKADKGWVGLASYESERRRATPASTPTPPSPPSPPVLAWWDPDTELFKVLLEIPLVDRLRAESRIEVQGAVVTWTSGGQLGRGHLVHDAAGTRLEQVDRVMNNDDDTEPITSLALRDDGAVLYATQNQVWSWGAGAPVRLGPGRAVYALAGNLSVTVEETRLFVPVVAHVYDPAGVELTTITLPADLRPTAVSDDRSSLLFTGDPGWAALDLHGPAPWASRPEPEAPSPTGREIQIVDAAGIPIAGVGLSRGASDLSGRGRVREGERIGGRWSGLEDTPVANAAVLTVRTLGERRARMSTIGAGVTLHDGGTDGASSTNETTGVTTPLHTYVVDAIDPDSPWASTLEPGDRFVPLGPAPEAGWTAESLWTAATARWPVRGLRAFSGNQLLELPGGTPCYSRVAMGISATQAGASPSSGAFDVLCPVVSEVGARLKPVSSAAWQNLDLVRTLAGSWTPVQPTRDLRARVRARLEALASGASATVGPNPAEEVEVAGIASMLLGNQPMGSGPPRSLSPGDLDNLDELLDVWFEVPREVPELVVGVSGKGKRRLVTWNGAPVQAVPGAGMVRILEPSGDRDRVVFADKDTILVDAQVYRRL